MVSCADLVKYKSELKDIYNIITQENNYNWIINHPYISTYDVCKDISEIFAFGRFNFIVEINSSLCYINNNNHILACGI